jgi:hypothetical protein
MSLFSGCATITRGTTEQLTVVSQPAGASVRLSSGLTGVTPATFTVPRKGDLMVTITKEGYEPTTVTVSTHLAGAGTAGFVGNALIGGIIGGGIDVATGATLSHQPNPVSVVLAAARKEEPLKPVSPPPEPAGNSPATPTTAPVAAAARDAAQNKPAATVANDAGASGPSLEIQKKDLAKPL